VKKIKDTPYPPARPDIATVVGSITARRNQLRVTTTMQTRVRDNAAYAVGWLGQPSSKPWLGRKDV